jgi:hypothetical protein
MHMLEVLCGNYPQGFNCSEERLEGYLGNNAARLLGLTPTPPPNAERIANYSRFID